MTYILVVYESIRGEFNSLEEAKRAAKVFPQAWIIEAKDVHLLQEGQEVVIKEGKG